jgi:hypothetical protein
MDDERLLKSNRDIQENFVKFCMYHILSRVLEGIYMLT